MRDRLRFSIKGHVYFTRLEMGSTMERGIRIAIDVRPFKRRATFIFDRLIDSEGRYLHGLRWQSRQWEDGG